MTGSDLNPTDFESVIIAGLVTYSKAWAAAASGKGSRPWYVLDVATCIKVQDAMAKTMIGNPRMAGSEFVAIELRNDIISGLLKAFSNRRVAGGRIFRLAARSMPQMSDAEKNGCVNELLNRIKMIQMSGSVICSVR